MTAREWLTIFRNHDELAKVFFQLFNILSYVVVIIFPKVYFKPKSISTLFPQKNVGYVSPPTPLSAVQCSKVVVVLKLAFLYFEAVEYNICLVWNEGSLELEMI